MTGEISRRRALQIAAAGAVGAVVGGVGTWRTFLSPASEGLPAEPGGALREPRTLASSGGRLDVELTAGRGVTVAGRRTQALGYNGSLPGPTLHVRPGDTLRVALTNRLDDTTNLHTHGLHVSPEGNSDNIFRMVEPGETAHYEYSIPRDHPTGTFWYHPHHHGTVADQVFGGLYGTLIVAGDAEPQVDRERVLVVSDITLAGDGSVAQVTMPQVMAGREGDLLLVNGQSRPRIDVAAGSVERWRVVNACTSRFLRLRLDGHSLGFLGYDGQALGDPVDRDTVVLAPGNRADLLVRPGAEGSFALRTLSYDRGGMGMMMGGPGGTSQAAGLATVRVSAAGSSSGAGAGGSGAGSGGLGAGAGGSGAAGAGAGAAAGAAGAEAKLPDLRGEPVDRQRSVTFTMGMGGGGMAFGFDGREFDPGRVDQRLQLGTVEEWTIGNASPMDHPFHLHVWPMQVVFGPDHDPGGPPDWRDVVIVPAGGQVRVRVPVTDFGGRTVYHCHILDHEDRGMMGIVEAT